MPVVAEQDSARILCSVHTLANILLFNTATPCVTDFMFKSNVYRYITVDDTTQRQLFYYLVTHEGADESSIGRDESPLIIWLTGGPGCSSLDAFTYENGPFIFSAPGKRLISVTAVCFRVT